MSDPQAQLDRFLAKFTPEVEALARGLFEKMKVLVSGATIMVYDNYNALAIGFAPDGKPSHAAISLAVMPRWVTLCFLFGKGLPDPHHLLKGDGSRVRNVRLYEQEALDDPRILVLIEEAIARSEPPFNPAAPQDLVIKSISAKQRPRRPKV